MSTFEIYKDKAGDYRFRYKAANGEILFASEGYRAKAAAISAIGSIMKTAAGAKVYDKASLTTPASTSALEKGAELFDAALRNLAKR